MTNMSFNPPAVTPALVTGIDREERLADHMTFPIARGSYSEGELPLGVRRLERPIPLARATALAFLRFEKADLESTFRFLADFGMEPVSRTERRIVLRGAGAAPCIYIAEKGRRSRFVGAAFVMAPETDFDALERLPGAQRLAAAEIPGGGRGIELIDPAGNAVWLIADWAPVPPLPMRAALHDQTNAPGRTPRINACIRPPAVPPLVGRLGHMVLQVTDFPAMAAWYMRHLGLIPSDVQYLGDGSPTLTFFRLDLGGQPADHHTLVLLGAIENGFEHSAHEMIDLDAIGQRQQALLAGGHTHMWGLGRHVLGSQIFNYWRDPDGTQFEHYTDGDLFTADYEPRYSPFAPGSIWAWGQDAPAALRGKPSPAMLWRILRALAARRISLQRLKLLGQALSRPARPWL